MKQVGVKFWKMFVESHMNVQPAAANNTEHWDACLSEERLQVLPTG